jgi:hypothetical protein
VCWESPGSGDEPFLRDNPVVAPWAQFVPIQNRMAQQDAMTEYLKFTCRRSSPYLPAPARVSTSGSRCSPDRPHPGPNTTNRRCGSAVAGECWGLAHPLRVVVATR